MDRVHHKAAELELNVWNERGSVQAGQAKAGSCKSCHHLDPLEVVVQGGVHVEAVRPVWEAKAQVGRLPPLHHFDHKIPEEVETLSIDHSSYWQWENAQKWKWTPTETEQRLKVNTYWKFGSNQISKHSLGSNKKRENKNCSNLLESATDWIAKPG